MPELRHLIEHWGYLAICAAILLGNLGVPVPEESTLVLAGYFVRQGDLRFPAVLLVGIVSAIAGDNLGYWIGRRYGQEALKRYGQWVLLTPARLEGARRLATRYGGWGVFSARFITGLRFMAGPVAGSTGLQPRTFLVANALGALVYVPMMVAVGYGVAYEVNLYLTRFAWVLGRVERLILTGAVVGVVAFLGWRALQAIRARWKF
jgi:membrane protein DedA with SNARE-associated domain